MSFVSLSFITFVALGLIIYYILPKKTQWVVLLLLSYAFYLFGGIKTVGYLVFTTITTYLAGILLARYKPKIIRRLIVTFTIIGNFGVLFLIKYWNFTANIINGIFENTVITGINILLPLGLSFYIFQSIGYVIDVYRSKYSPEKNLLKFALFVSFFPQMVQGPISRFDSLGKELMNTHEFSYDNIKDGIQTALWGYFKKLIIADRAAIVVNTVINSYNNYAGSIIMFSIILYSIQLYCDFSGGIDITRGIARMFGIDMIDNFKRPIFSTSLADYWRRWHISLGAWMKDYLFYPISLSKPFIKIGKFTRKIFKGKAGKILPVSLATFIVYFAIGIWHGASLKYIVFGIWNGAIITASLLLEPIFINLKDKLKFSNENKLFHLFQIIRTNILVLIGRYITRAPRFLSAVEMLRITVTNFMMFKLFDGSILSLGLKKIDYIIIVISLIVLIIVEIIEERGYDAKKLLDKKPFVVQWVVMMISIIFLLVFGVYRGNYIASEFIYKQF
jgi:D-alanyl-lipoteichoic acid acyltransferase DltB (MBOAT superfamily)